MIPYMYMQCNFLRGINAYTILVYMVNMHCIPMFAGMNFCSNYSTYPLRGMPRPDTCRLYTLKLHTSRRLTKGPRCFPLLG